MTQRPSQNKQILAKIDEIIVRFNEVDKKLTRIESQIEYQPKVDAEQHLKQDERINQVERRVKQLEDNQRWLIIAVLGSVVNAIMQLILH